MGALILLTLVVVAIIGVALFAFANRGDRLSRADRAELARLRALADRLYDEAADHIALGDSTLAPIVFDEIRQTRKELP